MRRLCRKTRGILGGRVKLYRYEWARWLPGLPGGVYLFTNVDALDSRMFERACIMAAAIESAQPDARILNDPRKALRRYELMRALHEAGINSFTCYRVDERRMPERWPVFVRGEYDHYGAADLLEGPEELRAAIAGAEPRAQDRARRLIVEFVDTRGEDGKYRKYSAFRVGSELIPAHIYFGEQWLVKSKRPPDAEEVSEEEAYVADDSDPDDLMRVFEIAGIDYGRIDYSRSDRGIEVWEVNMNPMVTNRRIESMRMREHISRPVTEKVAAAFAALANEGRGRPRIPSRAWSAVRGRAWRKLTRSG
jgi:hypothetical protein